MQSFRNKPFTILVQICSVFACSIKMQPQPVSKPFFFLRNWRLDFFYSDYPAYSIPAGVGISFNIISLTVLHVKANTDFSWNYSTTVPFYMLAER